MSYAKGTKTKRLRHGFKPTLDTSKPPPRVDRKDGAQLLYDSIGLKVSPRTLEGWPVPTRLLNGRATFDTAELLKYGRELLDGSTNIRGGRSK